MRRISLHYSKICRILGSIQTVFEYVICYLQCRRITSRCKVHIKLGYNTSINIPVKKGFKNVPFTLWQIKTKQTTQDTI